MISRTRMGLAGVVLASVLLLGAGLPNGAAGTVTLTAALTPEHLGAGTTIKFGFTITPPPGQRPSPLTEINLRYPANLGIATSGLGVANCTLAVLEAHGPSGCPVDSVMGFGAAIVEVPFGPVLLYETARTTTFMAPLHEGHLGLLFYADGESPVSAQIVFPGLILPAAAPFGGALDTVVPLVPSVPGAPDAALVKLSSTIGPSHITYFEYMRHKRILYRPRGILLPKRCPAGGFRFEAELTFLGGARETAETSVPCPAQRARARRGRTRSGGGRRP